MMKQTFFLLAASVATAMDAQETLLEQAAPEATVVGKDAQEHRDLQRFDFFDINIDLCDNRSNEEVRSDVGVPRLGRCDLNRFPLCREGKDQICYNRKPSRDEFVPGTHQPVYYIQYDRVFCYPNSFNGCSSCTPGRYCASESRCILDEFTYECARWF